MAEWTDRQINKLITNISGLQKKGKPKGPEIKRIISVQN